MTEHKPWLSLPDEDPPERGFAELMAAARVKAEVMANPPWWKRLFAVARRPPVLALATCVVVVCGVIVVGRDRHEAMSPAPAVDVPAGSLDVRARGAMPEGAPPPPVEKKHEAPRVLQPPPPDDPLRPADMEQAGIDTQGARSETATGEAQAAETKSVETNAVETKAVETKAPKGRLKKAADPLARCREAAARRDCATAKACVDGAPATYKASAANDAALKSCL